MLRYLKFIHLYFTIIPSFLLAQDAKPYFELYGNINADTGKIYILYSKAYSNNGIKEPFTLIKRGKFYLKGRLSNPMGMRLGCEIDSNISFVTPMFFIQKGKQTVYINIDSAGKMPVIKNSLIQDEYENSLLNMMSIVAIEEDQWFKNMMGFYKDYNGRLPDTLDVKMKKERDRIFSKKDTVLLEYVKENRESYIGLWKLIEHFTIFGYKSIYLEVFRHLSPKIKSTLPGKLIIKNLDITKVTAVGQVFPSMKITRNNITSRIDFNALKNRYTFVDFWFSYCRACIEQFEGLKSIYSDYREKGFEIISISTDKKENKLDWLNAIEKYQLPWIQYWDIDQIEAAKLSINAFPTNFLLDNKGKIIAKNIEPTELKEFLQKNLEE